MTTYSLKKLYPSATDIDALTHKQRLVLPWEAVESDPGYVVLVSGDRYYKATFYTIYDVLQIKVGRHYFAKPPKTVFVGALADMVVLPMDSLKRRIQALVQQYPRERLSETVHARDGMHSDFCPLDCKLPILHARPVMEGLPPGWDREDPLLIHPEEDILSRFLREEAQNRKWDRRA